MFLASCTRQKTNSGICIQIASIWSFSIRTRVDSQVINRDESPVNNCHLSHWHSDATLTGPQIWPIYRGPIHRSLRSTKRARSLHGHLQPRPLIVPLTQRNTTASSSCMHHEYGSRTRVTMSRGSCRLIFIQIQAEQIRREAEFEGGQTQREAKATLTRSVSLSLRKDHVNYVLMYNTLTGTRIAVSQYSSQNDATAHR